ncbi:MAG: PAS domain S-box protein, partial [bacterium]
GLGALYWLLESTAHTFVFDDGDFIKQLIAPGTHELWMRTVVVGILYSISVRCQFVLNKHKRVREQLIKFTQAIEQSPASVVITDTKGNIEYVNPKFTQLTGYGFEEVLGRNPRILKSGETPREEYERLWKLITSGKEWRGEFHNKKKNGELYWEFASISPIKNKEGEITHFLAVKEDITKRKQTDEELRKSERRARIGNRILSALLTCTDEAMYSDVLDIILEVFQSKIGLFGYIRKDDGALVCPSLTCNLLEKREVESKSIVFPQETWSGLWGRVLLEKKSLYKNEPHPVPEGHLPLRRLLGVPIVFQEKLIGAIHVANRDTDYGEEDRELLEDIASMIAPVLNARLQRDRQEVKRKQVEEALKESEEKFRNLAEQSPNMIFINKKGRVVYANKKCEEMMGYTKKEFYSPSFNFVDLVAPEYVDLIRANFAKHMKGKEVPPIEYALITKDGRRIDAIVTTKIIRYEGESAILGVITDITEHKRAEKTLRQSEEKYRTLFEESKEAVFISTPEGRFVDINPAGVELFGYASKDEILQVDIAQDLYVNPQDRDALNQMLKQKGFVKDYELVLKRKDGQRLFVLETATAVRDETGKIVAYRGIIHDLTERKQLEEQLRQAQKMETIGTLAGGIAHDFNNLLTVILGNTEFGLQNTKPSDPTYQELIRIERAATQARDLTQQLLSFSRRQVLNPKLLSLNKTIEDLLKMLKRIIGEDIELKTELAAKLSPVWADPAQVQQILMNLAVNARDAMPKGGKLLIETRNFVADDNFPIAENQVDGLPEYKYDRRNFVEITIADTGVGMEKETQARIFEPFFTTKEFGKGTGLGLSVVYGIVKQHGGVIQVDSELGKGTRFRIYFPAVPESEVPYQKKKTAKSIPGGEETILVVEDEEAVRNVTVRILGGLGYKVLTANDGLEACKVFEQEGENVDLAILDLVMPNISGTETCKKFRLMKPQLPVIFVTGYDINANIDEFEQTERMSTAVLRKPYTRDVLGLKVRELLDHSVVAKGV